MDYLFLKHTHVALAMVSVILFFLRAGTSLYRSRMPSLAFRVLAHLIDTLLLGFGVVLAYKLSISPLSTPWFAAKIIAIASYIGCGTVVMKGKSTQIKAVALAFSLVLIVSIICLAFNKDINGLNIF